MRKECLGVRFRATSGVPHERVGRIDRCRREREKEGTRARKGERESQARWVVRGERAEGVPFEERKQKRECVERERARTSANADECG